MKAVYKLMIVGGVVIFGLTGCFAAGIFNPFLGIGAEGDLASETGLITQVNTDESTSAPAANPFDFASVSGTLTNAIAQLILVIFNNGVVDVDVASGVIAGLTIYELLGPAASGGEYAQGATVSYTAVVTTDTGGNSTARLTLDLDSGTMSDNIEIEMDPALLTANGGTKQFNQDGDDTPAEPGEDAAYDYLAVGGTPPVTATGVARNPRDGIAFTLPGAPTVSDTTFLVTGVDTTSGGFNTRFTAATLSPGLSVFTFDPSTGAFTAESTTPSYDGAGTLTLTLANAVTAGEIYQIRQDDYNITSSETVYGFTQRATTDQNNSGTRYAQSDLLPEGAFATLNTAGTPDDGGQTPTVFINVHFTGVGDIVTSGITTDNIRFIIDENNDGNDLFQIPYDFFVVQDGSPGANILRFYFSPIYDPTASDRWHVFVYPSVMDDNGTPTDSTDDIPVLDVTETEAGVSTDTGIW